MDLNSNMDSYYRILLFIIFLSTASARSITVSETCDTDTDQTSVGRCLRPWLDLWEIMRSHEAASADLLFPLIYYEQNSVLSLCDAYLEARDTCLSDPVLHSCRNDLMIRFVQSHMAYFCAGDNAVIALARFECLSRTVKSRSNCRDHIRGIPLPGHQSHKCSGIPKFYECLSNDLSIECGDQTMTILQQAIASFGCSLDSGENELLEADYQQFLEETNQDFPAPNQLQASIDEVEGSGEKLTTDSIEIIEVVPVQPTFTVPPPPERVDNTATTHLVDIVTKTPPTEGPGLIMLNVTDHPITTVEETASTARTRLFNMEKKSTVTRGPGLMLMTTPGKTKPPPPGLVFFNEEEEAKTQVVELQTVPAQPAETQPVSASTSTNTFAPSSEIPSATRKVTEPAVPTTEVVETPPAPTTRVVETPPAPTTRVVETPPAPTTRVVEAPPAPTTRTTKPANTRPPTTSSIDEEVVVDISISESCSAERSTRVAQCLAPLSRRWEEIHNRIPGLRETVFPLFNYTTTDLLNLCEIIQVTLEDCLTRQLLTQCFEHPGIQFLNSILGFACGRDQTTFFLNYDCLNKVTLQNLHCYEIIPGQNVPGNGPEKCKRIPGYYDCMEGPISQKCDADAIRIFLRSILHFGCDLRPNQKISKPPRLPVIDDGPQSSRKEPIQIINTTVIATTLAPTTIVEETEPPVAPTTRQAPTSQSTTRHQPPPSPSTTRRHPSPSTTRRQPSPSTTRIQPSPSTTRTQPSPSTTRRQPPPSPITTRQQPPVVRPLPQPPIISNQVTIKPFEGNTPALSPTCTPIFHRISRDCVFPLLRRWSIMREKKPHLNQISFPLYKYQRQDLLELCDGYANMFLCGGFQAFAACLDDELVRFANSQLGYVCSPQNIIRFLDYHDCITDIVALTGDTCFNFIRGPSVPGLDANKCRGMPDFYKCLETGIRANCGQFALHEFQQTILQFGCAIF